MSKRINALLFSAAFLTSLSVFAQDRRDDADRSEQHAKSHAYYDSAHRDWHQWNDQENESYERYAKEHHNVNSDFSKDSERQQEQYWKWRHKHPDSH